MTRRGLMLLTGAALVVASLPLGASASGGCYTSEPVAPGSASFCVVRGPGRFVVASATQWELRVYRGAICTGSPVDIDSTLTRTGTTPSASALDFGAEPRCVSLTLTDPGFMAVNAEGGA